ncbi:MAG TPA: arsenate reductase ArsC [Candidatus Bathyarchaeia archaeon]|nr:arsenate reductase ArsC [Candidatus Bathyarchaeia archaeon]
MDLDQSKKILFVCVENAGRSQMAEGFFRKYAPAGYEPISAGTKPTLEINPIAVEAMREIGIDLTKQKPKILTNDLINGSVLSVNMGCMDKAECPALFMKGAVDWGIEDPKGKPLDQVRKIRDSIEQKVIEICKTLE